MLYKLILTGMLASTLMLAQGGRNGGGSRNGSGGAGVPSMQFAGTRLDRISEALKLNKDQKKDLKASFDEAQKEVTPIHDRLMKGRDAIADAVAAGKKPEEITPLITANSALDAQIAGIELKTFAALFKGLDKDQQNKPGMPMIFQGMKGIFNGKNWNSLE
jgi:hypothetical protein